MHSKKYWNIGSKQIHFKSIVLTKWLEFSSNSIKYFSFEVILKISDVFKFLFQTIFLFWNLVVKQFVLFDNKL